jgi:hypothetical protein
MTAKLNAPLTFKASVLAHLQRVGSISIREAMDDYGMSGGSLTKYISVLKTEGHTIHKEVRQHPISGRKYARYHLVDVYKAPEPVKVAQPSVELAPGTKVKLVKPFPYLENEADLNVGKVYTIANRAKSWDNERGYNGLWYKTKQDCDLHNSGCYVPDTHFEVVTDQVTITTNTRNTYPFRAAA